MCDLCGDTQMYTTHSTRHMFSLLFSFKQSNVTRKTCIMLTSKKREKQGQNKNILNPATPVAVFSQDRTFHTLSSSTCRVC